MYGALKSSPSIENAQEDASRPLPEMAVHDDDIVDEGVFTGGGSTDPIVDSSTRRQKHSDGNHKDPSGNINTNGPFHSVRFYVICQGLIQLSYLILGSYLKSVITSIEKRFDLDSKTAGFMSSGFEIGNLLVILPVSYFGRRIHRPRAIAVGVWFMIAGGVLLATPHWIYGTYTARGGGGRGGGGGDSPGAVNRTDDLCHMNVTTLAPSVTFDDGVVTLSGDAKSTASQSGIWRLMFFARILVGIGAAPVQPYGRMMAFLEWHGKD